jgi:lipid-binding SYLF domain-containing protein
MIRLAMALHAVCIVALLTVTPPAFAGIDEEKLVDGARYTVRAFVEDKQMGPTIHDLMAKAKAVLIFPSVIKGAFFIGGEGGDGVLLAKGGANRWSYPAFYTMGSASFGLQIGGKDSEVMLLIMTEKGINAVIDSKVKLGGDLSVAAGPVGAGAAAATTANLGGDILSFSRSRGAYMGVSLEGAVIYPREEWNKSYYTSKNATPKAVVIHGKYFNRQADTLRDVLARMK